MSFGVVATLTDSPRSDSADGTKPWLMWANCYNIISTGNNKVVEYAAGANWGG
ncbi:MAG: hypothetical protein QF704_03005 [Anaerolineales bacterium]|jgi:hypothetical protein|nr:hypothetical protein [Anaerolineales bacterium]MDP6769648.1 hypothetical protein [Anaerolineales bacterium]